jgi:hypothetical protein
VCVPAYACVLQLRALHDSKRTLPIAAYEDQILAAVKSHQVILVSGDTGCGKSTQVGLGARGGAACVLGVSLVFGCMHRFTPTPRPTARSPMHPCRAQCCTL